MAFTHAINLQIGLDLTKILSPKNIPGIKAYLGVTDDTDLLGAVANDQYLKISKAIENMGLTVLKADFETLNAKQHIDKLDKAEQKRLEEKEADQSEVDDNELTVSMESFSKFMNHVIKQLLTDLDENGEITKIDISSEYINVAPDSKSIQEQTGLNEEVELSFDELDQGAVLLVTYTQDDEMRFRLITNKDMEEYLNGKD